MVLRCSPKPRAYGGRVFAVTSLNELPDIAAKIGLELRNQYVLGYKPGNVRHNGAWRKIKVKLAPPKGLPPLSIYDKTDTTPSISNLQIAERSLSRSLVICVRSPNSLCEPLFQ